MSAARATRWFLFVALVAVAVTLLYGWFHSGKLPSQNLPTHSLLPVAQVPTPANSGKGNSDKPSPAARSADIGVDVRTMVVCRAALVTKSHLEPPPCDTRSQATTGGLQMCQHQTALFAKQMGRLASETAQCPETLLDPSTYYEALRKAALAGDVDAQHCFVQGYFSDPDGAKISTKEGHEYPELARQFIDSAFERGDWTVVLWLARVRLNINDSLLMTAYPFGQQNPDTLYRMNFLLQLGAGDHTAPGDAQGIADRLRSGSVLPADHIQEDEKWARNMYAQHFAGRPQGPQLKTLDICPSR
jgi:hypothetical protein